MRMHPYTYLCPPVCLPARLPVCPFQLALGKDDINAHPLRPMSYWLLYRHQHIIQLVIMYSFVELDMALRSMEEIQCEFDLKQMFQLIQNIHSCIEITLQVIYNNLSI